MTTQAIAFFSSAASALGGDFLTSTHPDELVFLVNILLRDKPRFMHTALIARPRAIQASAQSSFFCFSKIHSLLENLALQSLASQRNLKLFNASYGFLNFRIRDDRFIGTDCDQRTLQISFAPLKQLGCSQSMLTGHQRHRTSWLISLFDNFKLLHQCSAPAALNTGDHFHPVRSY